MRELSSPRAFAIVAQRAIEQGTQSPIGMLIWKLQHGEVEKTERALAREDEANAIKFGA